MINILLSQLTSILTGILGQNGVTVPTSDFSIHQPSALAVIVQFSYVVIIAPIVEEFIYRGAILTALSPYGRGAAVLFSALAFGLMHGNIPQAASAFGTGLVYAIIAAKCSSILPTVIIHCLNNLLANFSSISDAIGLEHYETFMSVAEIVIGLVGFMVLFTSLKKLIIDDSENVLTPKECRRYVFTNPATLIYMLCLIIPIIKSLVPSKQLKITNKNGELPITKLTATRYFLSKKPINKPCPKVPYASQVFHSIRRYLLSLPARTDTS